MIITFQNIEKLIFFDSKLRNLLPDFQNNFNSWGLAMQSPALKGLAQKMLIDFINQVEDKHLKVMSNYFGEEVKVKKIDLNVVKNLILSIHEVEDYLNSNPFVKESLFAYREEEQLYISIWR